MTTNSPQSFTPGTRWSGWISVVLSIPALILALGSILIPTRPSSGCGRTFGGGFPFVFQCDQTGSSPTGGWWKMDLSDLTNSRFMVGPFIANVVCYLVILYGIGWALRWGVRQLMLLSRRRRAAVVAVTVGIGGLLVGGGLLLSEGREPAPLTSADLEAARTLVVDHMAALQQGDYQRAYANWNDTYMWGFEFYKSQMAENRQHEEVKILQPSIVDSETVRIPVVVPRTDARGEVVPFTSTFTLRSIADGSDSTPMGRRWYLCGQMCSWQR